MTLYRFNDAGMNRFQEVFLGGLSEDSLPAQSPTFAEPLAGTREFLVRNHDTAKQLAQSVRNALGAISVQAVVADLGLWAWLTFVLRDVLFPKVVEGRRQVGELHTWWPSPPGDFQKAQRHRVRMPVLLLDTLGNDADHLLCRSPGVGTEIREQLTSQQDMFHRTFQRVARRLYCDDESGDLKRGAGGAGAGSPRRLARIRRQFDVTWDLYDLTPDQLMAMLPREFDRFKPSA